MNPERERPVLDAVRADHLEAGRDVVLDHGLWRRGEREGWTAAVRAAGGRPLLVYLSVERAELLRRLERRNQCDDANALYVTAHALGDFFQRFELPAPDEHAIVYTGDPAAVFAAAR